MSPSLMSRPEISVLLPSLAPTLSITGCGLPPDAERIFEPFYTTKAEGTGLGLSIVHKILEQHNATVEVVSEAGRGASFLIRFPLDQNGGDPCTGNGY